VQVTAYGRQTVPDWGVVRSCDPLQTFGAPIISLERLNLSRQILYTSRQCQFYARGWHITNNGLGYGYVTFFKILPLIVMQRDARICQRQLSYLFAQQRQQYIPMKVNFCLTEYTKGTLSQAKFGPKWRSVWAQKPQNLQFVPSRGFRAVFALSNKVVTQYQSWLAPPRLLDYSSKPKVNGHKQLSTKHFRNRKIPKSHQPL